MNGTRRVKQLKSSSSDLREIMDQAFAVRHIAEQVASFDLDRPSIAVREFMQKREFDVVGVRRDGYVCGYVEEADLETGMIGDHVRRCEDVTCVLESAPLLRVLEILKASSRVFVVRNGQVSGIVTRGDLQKAPVRMWLFGLVSLVEMQMLRLIREYYPGDTWRQILTEGRIEKALVMHAERRRRNEHIDLTDCLQFCDKRDIVLKTLDLAEAIGVAEIPEPEGLFVDLESLRNDLAHAQDIVSGRWPDLVDLAGHAEAILISCEKRSFNHSNTT